MQQIVDLRSDTVTRPSAGMREAIAAAEVGDDVLGDDPTVTALERRVSELMGKDAALFVPSGTMGNLACLASITEPGDEVILDRASHVFNNEVASVSTLAAVQLNPLDGDRGVITSAQIAPHIRPAPSLHQPRTRAIAIENTHNRAGGRVFPLDEMRRIRALADEHGLKVHLDGARLANAVVKTGVSFADYARCADTLSMCFSKGLGAPVGSIVVSDADTIDRARKVRKRLGGGMRQAGILAAAAVYALDHNFERLREDHANAAELAKYIEATDGLELAYPVETNIVIFRIDPKLGTAADLSDYLKRQGVLANPLGRTEMRMVTNLDVSSDDIAHACEVLGAYA